MEAVQLLHLSRRVNSLQHTEQFVDAAIEIGPITGRQGQELVDHRIYHKFAVFTPLG